MTDEIEYPNVTRSDWHKFSQEFWPRPIDQVIDRNEARLPDWLVPWARGVAIASDTLLRNAGYRPGMHRPHGWDETSPRYFVREMGRTSLLVRASDDTGLWTIERLGETRRYEVDEVLACVFGWTPIFTRSYQSAMRLAIEPASRICTGR
jgi:hypothetical protein